MVSQVLFVLVIIAESCLSKLESPFTDMFLVAMVTGTESETKAFMSVCVDTVRKYPMSDFVSPVFIFERLCSIIFPVSARIEFCLMFHV